MDESLLRKMICDHVVFRRPFHKLSSKYKLPAPELRALVEKHPNFVTDAKKARKSIMRRNYESLAPRAQKALKDILALDPVEPVMVKDVKVGTVTNASLVKVQKEVAEGILEAIGAKHVKPKGGGIHLNIGDTGRTRERGGMDHVRARPVKEILASCSLEKGESVKIVSTKELESSGVKDGE